MMQRAHSMYEFMCQRARDKLMLWDEVKITQSLTHFISLYDRCIVSLGWCRPDIWFSGAGSGPRATNWGQLLHFLPQENSATIVVIFYTPPSAVAVWACDIIHCTIADLHTQHLFPNNKWRF